MRKARLLVLTFFIFCASGLSFSRMAIKMIEPISEKVIIPIAEEIPQYQYPEYIEQISYYENWYKPTHLRHETITNVDMELTSLGYLYLTAYAPEECGYNGYNYPVGWQTASGIICHRASYENRITEPTTCAVDRRYYRIGSEGQQFYIPAFDRVFVAEDTGSAVIGAYHIDLFYDDYYEMASFPTGYYEVYSVEYIYTEEEIEYYDFPKIRGIRGIARREKQWT